MVLGRRQDSSMEIGRIKLVSATGSASARTGLARRAHRLNCQTCPGPVNALKRTGLGSSELARGGSLLDHGLACLSRPVRCAMTVSAHQPRRPDCDQPAVASIENPPEHRVLAMGLCRCAVEIRQNLSAAILWV